MLLHTRWRRWPYKNTTLLVISLLVFFMLARMPAVELFLRSVGGLGYVGAFIVGIFFVSIFTVAPAAVVLLYLAEGGHPWIIASIAGLGAMVGDYVIFRYVRDRIIDELRPVWQRSLIGSLTGRLFSTPYFSWLIPIVGMAVIASPLPDEVGVGMLGISRLRAWQFLVVTFLLNAGGILVIILLAVTT